MHYKAGSTDDCFTVLQSYGFMDYNSQKRCKKELRPMRIGSWTYINYDVQNDNKNLKFEL